MSPRKGPRRPRPPYLQPVGDRSRVAGTSHRKPAATGSGARRGFGATWWGAAWVEALEGRARLDPNRLPRGRGYARSGAVEAVRVEPGRVRAAVQGSRRTPYDVTVRVRMFDDGEWDRVLTAVAAQVGHTAALLDGELPPEVAADVAATGLELLPGPGDLQPRCSCPDSADPCKHAAAVCYLVADTLDADSFALLELRGRSREEVLAGLRTRRGGSGGASKSGGGGTDESTATARDAGVPARAAYAAYAAITDRELPVPPLPSAQPGQPAVLATDPPAVSGMSTATLTALAADAAARAHAMLVGPDPTAASSLGLDHEADLARRAAGSLGSDSVRSSGGSGALLALAAQANVSGPELTRRALAWQAGGVDGLGALTDTWQPEPGQLHEGIAALGDGVRRRGNRLTRGDLQLRLGRDSRWYAFIRRGRGWDPVGIADADPTAPLTAATR